MNIGPRSDGTIPDEVQQVLRDVGSWLKVNGEAIYGTRPWKVFGEGPTQVSEGSFHDTDTQPYTPEDFRFTAKGGVLYAIELGWPEKPESVIHTLKTAVAGEPTGGIGGTARLRRKASIPAEGRRAAHSNSPPKLPGKYAYAFRIRFAGGK